MIDLAMTKQAETVSPDRGRRLVLVLQGVFVAGVTVVHVGRGIVPSPMLLAVVALSLVLLGNRPRRWYPLVPFALLGAAYQSLGRLSHALSPADINITNLIAWEKGLFAGVIPTTYLQELFFARAFTPVLDVVANLLYFSHFVIPLSAGLVLWAWRRDWFWPYVFGLLCFSYVGFSTYLMFPAAPPWWAYVHGYLDSPVDLSHFVLSVEAMLATPNPVAAMPSLHCGYPLFVSLVLGSLWGRRWHLVHLLPVAVGFSVVYLGHHYVVDVLAGYGYGAAGYAVTRLVLRYETVRPVAV